MNKTKATALNKLYTSITNYFQSQHNYFEQSAKYLNDFIGSISEENELNLFDSYNNKYEKNTRNGTTLEMRFKGLGLSDFNEMQLNENDALNDKIKSYRRLKAKINRAESTPFLNEAIVKKYVNIVIKNNF